MFSQRRTDINALIQEKTMSIRAEERQRALSIMKGIDENDLTKR
jgi:hypothetical protein